MCRTYRQANFSTIGERYLELTSKVVVRELSCSGSCQEIAEIIQARFPHWEMEGGGGGRVKEITSVA